ncbi:serine/threonine-protein phosphatase 6 regulatory ankyrin repeat subunit B [Diachasma alloeum]|uniref:serine/threonine-protein phosphatase 6 regulatory ankyrin repeat subunit B n=1 Tax=Diachasma alloeum TaxID=454923 RepID=UPI0007383E88|nr:serine/threonine-protein phosphatase 6 regulatory ankyrin repeat subunit B [Diachasma alloeum]
MSGVCVTTDGDKKMINDPDEPGDLERSGGHFGTQNSTQFGTQVHENSGKSGRQDVSTWDESEYSCNDETASAASSASLGSHESNEFNESSGYNSPGNEGDLKCRVEGGLEGLEGLCVEDGSTGVGGGNGDEASDDGWEADDCAGFYEAVRIGDSRKVEELLGEGAIVDVDEPNWNVSGDPPLLVAATNHCYEVLRVLLAKGCNPGARSPRGETALHRAIINRGPFKARKFVEELLRHGCSSGVKEAGGGLTALHMLTRQLAHAYSSRVSQVDFQEALETLSVLAKAGAVNERDHQGRSALHILASSITFDNCRPEIEAVIGALLSAGGDPLQKNDRGETPLHEALEFGALNTADLLIPHTPTGLTSRYGETPLHIASRKNYLETVEKLLKRNENPRTQDAGGNTPVHLAAARGYHEVVSLLMTSNLVQLEVTNDEGLTALQVAAESGFIDTVRVLIDAGADLTCIDGSTTIHHRHPDISVVIDQERTKRNANHT